jgi:hypothetical protein
METSPNRPEWRLAAGGMLLLGCVLGGCSRAASIVLHQPFAPPSQQDLKLTSRWAFSLAGMEHSRCLLDFPLPGAADGPRDFHVYLVLPESEGDLVVGPDAPDGARGFLIQEVGRLRGKTEFATGTVRCRGVFLQPRLRRLDLDVHCADGASIIGRAYVQSDERELRKFEREFAADVRNLSPAPDEDAAGATPRRDAPTP